ncbi:stalk domain-containing protein [Paenibacillus sp. FSL R5-0928]|uniref:stalk domain-containing protein n=1 Tax=Paenibacillus sp. FSL R5-0928 TaxID=2921667 RepID=UPI0030DC3346
MKKAIIGLVAGMLIGSAGMAAAATTPTVQAALAKFTFSVDGQKQTLKNDPLVYKGTTYLPVREVAEITGYGLEYDNTKKSIDLKSKGGTGVSATENWITLDELNDRGVTITGNLTDTMILKNEKLTLEIPLPVVKKGVYSAKTDLGSIEFNFSETGTKINLEDLKAAGIIQ